MIKYHSPYVLDSIAVPSMNRNHGSCFWVRLFVFTVFSIPPEVMNFFYVDIDWINEELIKSWERSSSISQKNQEIQNDPF